MRGACALGPVGLCLVLAGALWVVSAPAGGGESILDFAVFAEYDVYCAAQMQGGLVGGNSNIVVAGGGDLPGVRAAGAFEFQGLASRYVTGDVIAGGDFQGGWGKTVTGSVHCGGSVWTPEAGSIHGDVVASGSVTVLSNGYVGGSILADGDAQIIYAGLVEGDLGANGWVYIGGESIVRGHVTHGGALTVGGAGAADGTYGSQSQGAVTVQPRTFTGAALPGPTAFSPGSDDLVVSQRNLSIPLQPGEHGRLELAVADSLYMTAGTYVFDSVDLSTDANLMLDVTGGEVRILAARDVSFAGLDVLLSVDGGRTYLPWADLLADDSLKARASQVRLELGGTLHADGGSEWFGTIYASGGGIRFDGGGVIGALHAGGHIDGDANQGGIYLADGTTIDFVAPFVAPEPATLVLLAVAAAGLLRTRRRS